MVAKRHPCMVYRGAEDLWTLDTCIGPFEYDFIKKESFGDDQHNRETFKTQVQKHFVLKILEKSQLIVNVKKKNKNQNFVHSAFSRS
jgi:hypothetical protein